MIIIMVQPKEKNVWLVQIIIIIIVWKREKKISLYIVRSILTNIHDVSI